MRNLFFLACFILSSSFGTAQKLDHVLGDLLIRIEDGKKPDRFLGDYQTFRRSATALEMKRMVSEHMNTFLVRFDQNQIHETAFLDEVRKHPDVHTAQFNHILSLRETTPNDPEFDRQWQYINTGQSGGTAGADIDIELAWDFTTGGVTANGDSIVVCVIDLSFFPDHPDLKENYWTNRAEIPQNGIDDDGNGFIDDVRGWSVDNNNDNIVSFGGHGNSVAGIVGAKGNNEVGVAGVNWDVKLMLVELNSLTESNVLTAYSYPLGFKKKYCETNGAEGAFVVATNASWGIDFGQPDDAPLWCAMYDTLGAYGILSCGATANRGVDIDIVGDLPTGCSSEFLISVTNMNDDDIKVNGAGYGATTIDIGAFGADTWTVRGNENYGEFGGTSGATPHVAGTIALLYSTNTPILAEMSKSSPAVAARIVRDAILEGVDPNASLQGITTTGGRLNVNNAVRNLLDLLGSSCPPPFAIELDSIVDVNALVSWIQTDSINAVNLDWRPIGTDDWNTIDSITSPYRLEGLTACHFFELRLVGICDDSTSVSDTIQFETDGCCELPEMIETFHVSETEMMISWDDVLAGVSHSIAYRNTAETTYDTITTMDNVVLIDSLQPCAEYEFRINTDCDTLLLDYSGPMFFRTLGCGACLDFEYCELKGNDISDEWIERVTFGPLNNVTGENDGYAFFPDIKPLYFPGIEYILEIQPGFSSDTFDERFLVWIDLDMNGMFEDSLELIYDSQVLADSTVTDTLVFPAAIEGCTRMRVAMKFDDNGAPEACGSFQFGEVEDYCINIGMDAFPCDTVNMDSFIVMDMPGFNDATIKWDYVDSYIAFNYQYRKIGDEEWTIIATIDNWSQLTELEECTSYEIQVQTVCDFDTSAYSPSLVFTTQCMTAVEAPEEIVEFTVFPNPFTDQFAVRLRADVSDSYVIQLYDLNGNLISQDQVRLDANLDSKVSFDRVAHIPPGIYLVSVTDGVRRTTKKVVKL